MTTATDQQLGHWRTITPHREGVRQFMAQWLDETGANPTGLDVARAFGFSVTRAYGLMTYKPVTNRKRHWRWYNKAREAQL